MKGPGPFSARVPRHEPEGAERSTRHPADPGSCVSVPRVGAANAPAGNARAASDNSTTAASAERSSFLNERRMHGERNPRRGHPWLGVLCARVTQGAWGPKRRTSNRASTRRHRLGRRNRGSRLEAKRSWIAETTEGNAMTSLEGTVALVTGASSGIGEATARALASRGAKVAVAARRLERLERLAEEIGGQGHTALAIEADITDQAQAIAAVDRT